MQTCLEKRSIEQRHITEVRSDYNRENQYSENHPDARAAGGKGKGTGHPGGINNNLPNCNGKMGVFDYSNFDTSLNSGAGNLDDNKARHKSLARSLYNEDKVYSAKLIDTKKNRKEGQYQTY